MQFFDRPARGKIALRGSSSRPPSSQELLSRAKKAREERARRRRQQTAATTLQAAYRQKLAIEQLANSLLQKPSPSNPRIALVHLLLLSGALNASNQSVSANLTLLRRNADARHFLMTFALRLVKLLSAKDTNIHACCHQPDKFPEPMLVKAVVVLFAVIISRLSNSSLYESSADAEDVQEILSGTILLIHQLTPFSLEAKAKWGFYVAAVDVLCLLSHHQSYRVCADAFRDVVYSSIELADHHEASKCFSTIVYRQFALSLFAVNNVQQHFPLKRRPALITRLLSAVANVDSPTTADDFCWDVASSYSSLGVSDAAIMLSNVLEVGASLWQTKDKNSLWSFLAILSSLVQSLPVDYIDPERTDDDEEMSDVEGIHQNGPSKGSLHSMMTRLSHSFREIVSEETVRYVFTAASAEGRYALIRACQLFNFLIKRERGLGLSDAFLGSLAFWRGSRIGGSNHILKTLWLSCKKVPDEGNHVGPRTEGAISLSEDATPILAVFVSAYAYLLFIQDGDELFESSWPFSIGEVREITQVLKQYLFAALYVTSSGRLAGGNFTQSAMLLKREHNLTDDVTKLLARLHACDSQRPFRTGEDFWLAGRGVLSSEAFLQDAIQAGPNALTQSPDVAGAGRDLSPSAVRAGSVTGAGELLRMAPYLVPFSVRAKIFQSWIARERDLANGGQSFFPSGGTTVSVRRKFVFEDAFQELNGLGNELRATIRVKFIDEHGLEEAGIDGGGVYKEFMHEVLKLGFSPYLYGLFKSAPDGRLYPSPDAAIGNENFRTQFAFLGRLLGKAVFDGVLVNVPLASFFLSKMLGQVNHPIDLGSLDPELYKNMKYLKNCPPDTVEDLGLNFTVANNAFGTTKEVELKRNGKHIPITASNRIEYMHRVANYRMNTQIREQCNAFIRGFTEVVPSQFVRLFSREELQLLISGKTGKIDLDDLRRNTKYSGGYDENTPVIQWFWQAMGELNPEEQSKMLQFVTSSPRAPLLGFSYLVPGFCIHRAEGEVRLPTASTCMNLLKLPNYQSLDVVREKLRYALTSNAGFDLS